MLLILLVCPNALTVASIAINAIKAI